MASPAAALDTFRAFLAERGIAVQGAEGASSLEELVAASYELLKEDDLRSIAAEAVKTRDRNLSNGGPGDALLQSWGLVMDAVRHETQIRFNKAQAVTAKLVSVAQQGNLDKLSRAISQSLSAIDKTAMELLMRTLKDREQNNDLENSNMLRYIMTEIFRQRQMNSKVTEQDDAEEETEDSDDEAVRDMEDRLVRASNLLNSMLRDAAGDVSKLTSLTNQFVAEGAIDDIFVRVLTDNISACEAAGYTNKLKVLNFLKSVVLKELENIQKTSASVDGITTQHAPQFVGDRFLQSVNGKEEISVQVESSPVFIESATLSESLVSDGTGNKNKKKTVKSANKKKIEQLAKLAAEHLDYHRWAVCDHFLPLELIRRVRVEANLFQAHYENSEIWVGKEADVGAQLSVPSVRGDRVLWMCGGHTTLRAPEGISRVVRTTGEIEPCRLDVKQTAPIRKFHGLKELINAVDKFVFELRQFSSALTGVYERSDAMMAVYPGHGSRFANHIDNTTGDGRRLTVLIYLNPNWNIADGGALRVTVPHLSSIDGSKTDVSKSIDAIQSNLEDLEVTILPEHLSNTKTIAESKESTHYSAVDIFPNAGRMAMFFSSEVPHEVLPTFADRHALTIWYYDAEERKQAVARAKESGRAEKTAKTSIEDQKEAKGFMQVLMGSDDSDIRPSDSEMEDLRARVKLLSDTAIDIVASVTGAPSVDSFRTGFDMLTTEDLQSMRLLFRRMGLK